MNLRDQAGQRLMVSFRGTEVNPQIADFILSTRAGGVILFGFNIVSLEQVRRLNRDLQDLAARYGLPPLLIGIDEEGGRVSRLPADGQGFIAPSQMALAAAGPDAAAASAGAVARLLGRLGFNIDFAPVADVNNNPANPVIASRSYGSQPELVAELVARSVGAFLENGVAPCVKHFPGHGDTGVDSHWGLPVIEHDRARLDRVELRPFRTAFAAGAPALMTAHILYPNIDPSGLPATLSPFFLKQVLRQELGFRGVVFSDALDMQAIAGRYKAPAATLMTLAAGADIAMPLGGPASQQSCYAAIVEKADGPDMEASVSRIMALKERFGRQSAVGSEFDAENERSQLLELARRSITLVGRSDLLPLPAGEPRPVAVDFELPIASPAEEGRRPGPLLKSLLQARWPGLDFHALSQEFSDSQASLALQAAQNSSLVLVLTRNATRTPRQQELLGRLLARQPRSVLVAARDPYDLTLAPAAGARLATYGDPPVSIRALVELLFGEVRPQGRLPVSLD